MTLEERLSKIVAIVLDAGTISVDEVMSTFGVSAATARRDLDALAKQQLITRTRGGAMANPTSGELPLRYRAVQRSAAKEAIAKAAVDLIVPGSVVSFSGGTTATVIAHQFGVKASATEAFAGVLTTVVTNAVNIANDLVVRPELRIVVTGGVARTQSYELTGPLAMANLPMMNIDLFFLGVTAIDLDRGFFTTHEGEAQVNHAFIEHARATYIVADSTKFTSTSFARICGIDDVRGIITDSQVNDEIVAKLRNRGLDVLVETPIADTN